jgi:hypothetical protein
VVPAAGPESVVRPGALDHGGGDVHAVALLEAFAECLRQPADAAPEVEAAASRHPDPEALGEGETLGDLLAAGGEELLDVPASARLQRI